MTNRTQRTPDYDDYAPLLPYPDGFAPAGRDEARAYLIRSAGKDLQGAKVLTIGQNGDPRDPGTIQAIEDADALATSAGYVQAWSDKIFPDSVHPALRPIFTRCVDSPGGASGYMLVVSWMVKDSLIIYTPCGGFARCARIYVTEENLDATVAALDRHVNMIL